MESKTLQVIQGKDETRIEYLIRVAVAMLRNNMYSIDSIKYDDAECDASCLAYDLESELNESTLIAEHKMMLKALARIADHDNGGPSGKIAVETLKQITL